MACASLSKARTSSILTSITLRPGLSFCFVGKQAIFLDLARNRYFALPNQLSGLLRRYVEGEHNDGDAEMLIAHGIAVRSETAVNLEAQEPIAVTASIEPPVLSPSLIDLPEIIYRHAQVAARLYLTGLPNVIARIHRRKSSITRTVPSIPHAILSQRFAASNLLISRHDRCLLKSLALMDLLLAHRCEASLVFGVQCRPFHAHCWVQHGDCLLNEDVDVALAYTPILVV